MYKYIFLATILFISCNRIDYFYTVNDIPVLNLSKDATNFSNTIFDTIKLNYSQNYYYSIIDTNNCFLSFTQINDDSISVFSDHIFIKAMVTGNNIITFSATDIYKQKSLANINLYVFNNLLPIANLSLKKNNEYDELQIQIDGSLSFDSDKNFGGNIILYEYTINENIVLTKKPVINYIFQNSGQKSVSLRVMDNDSAWSNKINKFILL